MKKRLSFAVPAVVVMLALAALAATFTSFKTFCNAGATGTFDPIVAPGQNPFGHKHQFFGGTAISPTATVAQMQAGGTTCDVSGDTAGYWIPVLRVNGVETPPKPNKGVTAWYSPDAGVDYTFPRDLRIIAGNANATSEAENPALASDEAFFNCYGVPGGKSLHAPVECADMFTAGGAPASRHDIWVTFPSCWNGVDLDSADHRSHMSYRNSDGTCPPAHPVRLPKLSVQVSYPAWNGSETVFSSGPWYTLHFDFWNTWNQATLEGLTTVSPPGGTPTPTPTPTPPANNPPVAAYTFSCNRLTCQVNGSTSTDSDGSIVSYSWAWGDGASSSGVTASHCYDDEGSYQVTLTVTDDDGATDVEQKTVSPSGGRC